jgi:hypothetical protein
MFTGGGLHRRARSARGTRGYVKRIGQGAVGVLAAGLLLAALAAAPASAAPELVDLSGPAFQILGTDPSLPTLGTGEYDWQGFLTLDQHPHEVDPAGEVLLNWNGKPAPEWGAASDNYSYGPIPRVQMYQGFTSSMNEAGLTTIMNRAATQDLRAVKDWPVIQHVLEGGPAPSNLAEEAANLVTAWVAKGASRGGLKRPSNPGAAVLDAAWTGIADAVLGPVLGEPLLSRFASINGRDDAPSPHGSWDDSGWYGYVYKDLRSELGLTVEDPYSRQYCGEGSLEACGASLWAAIQAAAVHLQSTQSNTPSNGARPPCASNSRRTRCSTRRCAGPTARPSSRSSSSPGTNRHARAGAARRRPGLP